MARLLGGLTVLFVLMLVDTVGIPEALADDCKPKRRAELAVVF